MIRKILFLAGLSALLPLTVLSAQPRVWTLEECIRYAYDNNISLQMDRNTYLSGLEDTEQLDVVLADREEARRILREENVAANCAYLLMQFLHNPDDPLAFLRD